MRGHQFAVALIASCFLAAGGAAADPVICLTCAAKHHSTARADAYVARALATEDPDRRRIWLRVALTFDPDHEEAKRLLRETEDQR